MHGVFDFFTGSALPPAFFVSWLTRKGLSLLGGALCTYMHTRVFLAPQRRTDGEQPVFREPFRGAPSDVA